MEHTQRILDYLRGLSSNNNREWYHAHKKEKTLAMESFEQLVQDFMIGISAYDDSVLGFQPKELIFSLVRDTRFSHDKSPYRPAFRAHISSKGKLPIPVGYFLSIEPNGNTMLGGGLFADMFKDATTMIRDELLKHGEEFHHIVTEESFTEYFTLLGTKLKKVPRGYDPNHPYGEYLKHKSWFVEFHVPDEIVEDHERFLRLGIDIFQRAKPFNDFLNRALVDFEMPKR